MKLSTIPLLTISMITVRISAGLTVAILVQLFGIKMNPIMFVKGAIITGLPGIMAQLIFIPPLVYAINSYMKKKSFNN